MNRWVKPLAAALLLPLVLAGCLFMPGQFESTLTIHADRSFTFAYKGEVLAVDLAGGMTKAMSGLGDAMKSAAAPEGDDDAAQAPDPSATPDAEPTPDPAQEAADKAKKDAEYREIAAKLEKEAGYRSVTYQGDGKFLVDYQISGVLSHGFVYPYNLDAAMMFPWVSVELRGKDLVRVKAPGFAKQDSSQTGGMDTGDSKVDGTFTLITDAEVVSQNEESGATVSGTTRTYKWHVTPLSQDAPMAVLRVKPI